MIKLILSPVHGSFDIKTYKRKHTTIPTISTAGTARWWTFAAADHGVPGGLPHDEWQVGRHDSKGVKSEIIDSQRWRFGSKKFNKALHP